MGQLPHDAAAAPSASARVDDRPSQGRSSQPHTHPLPPPIVSSPSVPPPWACRTPSSRRGLPLPGQPACRRSWRARPARNRHRSPQHHVARTEHRHRSDDAVDSGVGAESPSGLLRHGSRRPVTPHSPAPGYSRQRRTTVPLRASDARRATDPIDVTHPRLRSRSPRRQSVPPGRGRLRRGLCRLSPAPPVRAARAVPAWPDPGWSWFRPGSRRRPGLQAGLADYRPAGHVD